MTQNDRVSTVTVQPNYVRLVDPHTGRFVGEFDPHRFILMTVHRGGTAYFDLARLREEALGLMAAAD